MKSWSKLVIFGFISRQEVRYTFQNNFYTYFFNYIIIDIYDVAVYPKKLMLNRLHLARPVDPLTFKPD